MSSKWTGKDMPDLAGKTAIVTGANSGIGYETARALAGKRATVILACRSPEKGETAAGGIAREHPSVKAEPMLLDLGDLSSVRRFASEFAGRYDRLDLLVNNAGIMATPFKKTFDDFEAQFATNHLGHFALTGLLLERILYAPRARVITVSSGGHCFGEIDFDNLNGDVRYDPRRAYAQTKLANLLFTYELQRRFEGAGVEAVAAAAHPGWTATNLQAHWRTVRIMNLFLAQKPVMGALPTLYAATAPDVRGGEYYGPDGWQELRGYPVRVSSSSRSHDAAVAARLWEVSEELTGVRYSWPAIQ
jgi:NAD(P)-dependent dehydrogenase (short-subunit alcohol dehydrogenase family)